MKSGFDLNYEPPRFIDSGNSLRRSAIFWSFVIAELIYSYSIVRIFSQGGTKFHLYYEPHARVKAAIAFDIPFFLTLIYVCVFRLKKWISVVLGADFLQFILVCIPDATVIALQLGLYYYLSDEYFH